MLLRHKANKKACFAGKWIERIAQDVARFQKANSPAETDAEEEVPPSRVVTPEITNEDSKVSVQKPSTLMLSGN